MYVKTSNCCYTAKNIDKLSREKMMNCVAIMSKSKAKKTTSLPLAVCKTDIISVKSNDVDDEQDVRKRSSTWHGIEDMNGNLLSNGSLLSVPCGERKTGRDHQDIWETRIKIVAEEALSDKLRDIEYDHNDCKQLCTSLSKVVHDRLKGITDMTFKIVVLSFIGELQGDGIEAATQCTWEPRKDTMVAAYFKNETLFALTNIFMTRIPETSV